MAKGDMTVFDAVPGYLRDGDVNLNGASWKIALLTNPITALLRTETNPALGSTNATEVTAGGSYTAGGQALTLANEDSGGTVTMKLNLTSHPSGRITWAQQAGSPANVKTALIYDDSATTPTDAAIAAIDLTNDNGVTPVSIAAAALDIDIGAGDAATGEILRLVVP